MTWRAPLLSDGSGLRGRDQLLERPAGVLEGPWVAQQSRGVVVGVHQPLECESELLDVQVGAKVTLGDGGASDRLDELGPVALTAHQRVAHRARLVVVLDGSGDEDAPALQ